MTFSQCEHVGEKKKTPRTFDPDAGADDGTADAPTGGDTAGSEALVEPVLPGDPTAGEAAAGAAWDASDAGDAGEANVEGAVDGSGACAATDAAQTARSTAKTTKARGRRRINVAG
jgi:hypothetical protein